MSKSRSKSPSKSKSRSKSYKSVSSSPERFQYENCQFDPVSNGYRIHLADLPDNPDETELANEFVRYGPLTERPWVARASPCFGFVVFKYKKDAFDACKKMDNKQVCGTRIRTSFALPRNRGRGGGGAGVPRCYQCGRFGHYSRDCKPKVTRAVRDDTSSEEERSPSRTPERERERRRYSSPRDSGPRGHGGGGGGGSGPVSTKREGGGSRRSRSRSRSDKRRSRRSRSRTPPSRRRNRSGSRGGNQNRSRGGGNQRSRRSRSHSRGRRVSPGR